MLKKRYLAVAVLIIASVIAPKAIISALTQEKSGQDKLNRDYIKAMSIIRDNYVEAIEYEPLNTAAIQGMLRSLDPHSNYYDRKSFEEMRLEQRSQYYGIGASIQPRFRGVYIMEPFVDSPAWRAGLRYGDQIIAINGQNTEEWSSDKVRDNLRGDLGTEVKVTVRRVSSKQPVNVTIERAAVDLPAISAYYLLGNGVGYVALSRGFHSTTYDELNAAVADMKSRGMTSLILDLRGNPGGLLEQAIKISDKYLERGQAILSVRSRYANSGEKDYRAESGSPDSYPVVVMIDEGSASASEIVAGAIQDHDRGLIIGEPSFGKGLVQTMFPLVTGAGLTLTTARYYTPSGRSIQRDYSNGSTYEYHFRRDSNGNKEEGPHNDMRRTDTGRVVYGGGGIEPDIKITPSPLTTAQTTIWTTGLFYFVREMLAGNIPEATSFKISSNKLNRNPDFNEYLINDSILNAYRKYLLDFIKEHREVRLTESTISDNLEWARTKIREEVLTAAYGTDMQRRIMAQTDLQLQKAVQEMPQAALLAEQSRKLIKTSKK